MLYGPSPKELQAQLLQLIIFFTLSQIKVFSNGCCLALCSACFMKEAE